MGNNASSYATNLDSQSFNDLKAKYEDDLKLISHNLEDPPALSTKEFHASSDLVEESSRATNFDEATQKALIAQLSHAFSLEDAKNFPALIENIVASLTTLADKFQPKRRLAVRWNALVHMNEALMRVEAFEAKKKTGPQESGGRFQPTVTPQVETGLRFIVKSLVLLLKQACNVSDVAELIDAVLVDCEPACFSSSQWSGLLNEVTPLARDSLLYRLKLGLLNPRLPEFLDLLPELESVDLGDDLKAVLQGWWRYLDNGCCTRGKFEPITVFTHFLNEGRTVVQVKTQNSLNVRTYLHTVLQGSVFYVEFKVETVGANLLFGVSPLNAVLNDTELFYTNEGKIKGKSCESFGDGDVIGLKVDFIEQKCVFYKNSEEAGSAEIEFPVGRVCIRTSGGSKVTLVDNPETTVKHISLLNPRDKELPQWESTKDAVNSLLTTIGRVSKQLAPMLGGQESLPEALKDFALLSHPNERTLTALKALLLRTDNSQALDEALLDIVKVHLLLVDYMKLKSSFSAGFLEEMLDLLEQVQANAASSETAKQTAREIVVEAYDLFFESADDKLENLTKILNTGDTGSSVNQAILKKSSTVVSLSRILAEASDEKLTAFQTLLLDKLGNSEIAPILNAYLPALYSHTSRKSKDVFKTLFEAAAFKLLLFGCNKAAAGLPMDVLAEEIGILKLLLWSIPVIELDHAFLHKVLPVVATLDSHLRPLEFPEETEEITESEEVFESKHPCSSGTYDHSIKEGVLATVVSVATEAVLTEEGVVVKDRGIVVGKLKAGEELRLNWPVQASLSIKIEGEEEGWGYLVRLKHFTKSKISHLNTLRKLQSSTTGVYLRICELLVGSLTEGQSALSNILVKDGIAEEAWSAIGCEPEISSDLKTLVEASIESEMPLMIRSVSLATEREHKTKDYFSYSSKTLEDYLMSFGSPPHFRFDKNYLLEVLIDNKGTGNTLWTALTEECKLTNSIHNSVGGAEGDKAERAILAVLIKIFYHPSQIEQLFQTEANFPTTLKVLRKKAHELRTWLRSQIQKEKDVAELCKNVLRRCVILLNCDFFGTVERIGVKNIRGNDIRGRSWSMGDEQTEESKWEVARKLPVLLRRVRVLMSGAAPPSKETPKEQQVHRLVFDFVSDESSIEDMASEMNSVRNSCISRIAGINFISKILTKKTLRQVSSALTRAMTREGRRVHYLEGLEGVDYSLKKALSKSFFQLYRQLIDTLIEFLETEPNWLSDHNFATVLQVASLLAMPFTQVDADSLLSIDLHKAFSAVLDIAKGKIKHIEKRKVDSSVTVNDLEFCEAADPDSDWIRLADTLYVKPKFGEQPFTRIEFSAEPVEGLEKLPQATSEGKSLWVTREPAEQVVSQLQLKDGKLEAVYKSVSELYQNSTNPELKERRETLQWCFWSLFKMMSFTMVARPEESWENTTLVSTPAFKLREAVLYIILNELTGLKEVEPQVKLELLNALDGKKWGSPMDCACSNLQILEFLERHSHPGCTSLPNLIERYRKWDFKLTGKPVPLAQIKEVDNAPLKPEWLNDNKEFDLFWYLKSQVGAKESDLLSEASLEYLDQSTLVKMLPETMNSEGIEWPLEFMNIPKYITGLVQALPSDCKLVPLLEKMKDSGVLDTEAAQEFLVEVDTTWINHDGQFDLFCFLSSVNGRPALERNAEYTRLLMKELSQSCYAAIPPSVSFVHTLKPREASRLHFVHSVLWLIHSLLSSRSTKAIVSRQEFIRELGLYAFNVSQPSSAVYAMKILERVVPEAYSEATIDNCLELDKALFTKCFGFAADSFLEVIFGIAGSLLTHSLEYAGSSKFDSQVSLSFPATQIGKKLAKDTNWQPEIFQKMTDLVDKLTGMLSDSDTAMRHRDEIIGLYHILLGFFSILLEHPLSKEVAEWSPFKRKSGEVGIEILLSYETEAKVYQKLHSKLETVELNEVSHSCVENSLDPTCLSKDLQQLLVSIAIKVLELKNCLDQLQLENTSSVFLHRSFMKLLTEDAARLLATVNGAIDEPDASHCFELLFPLIGESSESLAKSEEEFTILQKALKKKVEEKEEKEEEKDEKLADAPPEEVKRVEVEENSKTVEINSLYMLRESESANILCYSEDYNVSHTVNKLFHHSLNKLRPSKYAAWLETTIGPSLFRNVQSSEGPLAITLYIAVSASPDSVISVSLGQISLQIIQTDTCACTVRNGSETVDLFAGLELKKTYEFSIVAYSNYSVEVLCRSFQKSAEFVARTDCVFDGFRLGKFRLILESGTWVILKGLSIYENRIDTTLSFWKDNDEQLEPYNKERIVILSSLVNEDPIECLLSGTGLPEQCQQQIQGDSIAQTVEALIGSAAVTEVIHWRPTLKDPITDLLIVDKLEDLPIDYKPCNVWASGKFVDLQEYGVKSRILAYRKTSLQTAKRALTSILLQKEDKANNSTELVGKLHPEEESEDSVAATYLIASWTAIKETVPSYISELCLAESDSMEMVSLPIGYLPILYPYIEKATTIGIPVMNLIQSDTRVLFVAACNNSSIFNVPIKALTQERKSTGSSSGELADSVQGEDTIDSTARDALNLISKHCSDYSKHELRAMQSRIRALFIAREASIAIASLGKLYPHALAQCLTTGDNFRRFFFVSAPKQLEEAMMAVLQTKDVPSQQVVLKEFLTQVIVAGLSINKSARGVGLEKESPHPYHNNMDVYDDLSIPGAYSLQVEFDPATHTENGCDPLRFYRDAERQNMLYQYSGEFSSFKPFTVEGDTLHMWFHTDGSVVYWGYKFKVTPLFKFMQSNPVIQPQRTDIMRILSIYEKALPPQLYPEFYSPVIVGSLLTLGHTQEDLSILSRVLKLFRSFVTREVPTAEISLDIGDFQVSKFVKALQVDTSEQGRTPEFLDDPIQYFYQEIQTIGNKKLKKSPIFKSLLELQLGKNRPEPFIASTDTVVNAIYSFSVRGSSLLWMLLNFFSNSIEPLQIIEESSHPYSGVISKEIDLEGVCRCEIEVDSMSRLEDSQSFLVSTDIEATNIIPSASGATTGASLEFDPERTAERILLEDNNRSAMRRSTRDGWNLTFSKQTVSKGSFSAKFKLVKCRDASDMWLGIHEVKPNLSLTECPSSSSFGAKTWTYVPSGEFSSNLTEGTPLEMKQDGILEISGDMSTKSVQFSVDGNIMVTTTIDVDEIAFHVALGCTKGNKVAIEAFKISQLSGLSGSTYSVNTDRFYIHYPVNSGYIPSKKMKWRACPDVSSDELTVTKTEEGVSAYFTEYIVAHGVYQVEFLINRSEQGHVLVGLFTEQLQALQSLSSPNCFMYSSSGQTNLNCINHALPSFTQGDRVRFVIDVEAKTLSIFKNWEQILHEVVSINTKKVSYYFGAIMDSPKQSVSLYKHEIPTDLMSRNCDKESKLWGLKLYMKPVFSLGDSLNALEQMNEGTLKKLYDFLTVHLNYSSELDMQLVNFIDDYLLTKSLTSLDADTIEVTPTDKLKFSVLEQYPIEQVRQRLKFLNYFNDLFSRGLEYIDLNCPASQEIAGLMKHFSRCQSLILFASKDKLLKDALRQSEGSDRMDISIDKLNAVIMRQQGVIDHKGEISVFGQIMRALKDVAGPKLRNKERVYTVEFLREGSADAGGPYNETFSIMCDELMSNFLPLFVPSPNNANDVGQNRECFVLNPGCDSEAMFTFLGKLFGIAIRTQNNLNLMLSPFFWKKLNRQELKLHDLKDFDESAFQAIDMLQNPSSKGLTQDDIQAVLEDLDYTTRDSAGNTVVLTPKDPGTALTLETVPEYIELVTNARLYENDQAYECIRNGMNMIVPTSILRLFSWHQLEKLVCGSPVIDVERLKGNASYEGYEENDETIGFFWAALEEFNNDERRMFLRFVWGRSRLPAAGSFKTFTINHLHADNPNMTLPIAHTCFFSIDLPKYTNKESLKKKILYAITHCQAIDLDHDVGEEDEE